MADLTIEINNELERLLITQENEKKIQGIIRNVLRKARKNISSDIQQNLGADPRQAYLAVKSSVYKRILGGNISILSRKKASGAKPYDKPRTLKPGQRGGNRTPRSQRTEDLESYWGRDRGFVLRFLNSGTGQRTSRYGNRGSISVRNFFASDGQVEMERVMEELSALIDREINNAFE